MRPARTPEPNPREAGIGLIEVLAALVVLAILSAILMMTMGGTKTTAREQVSMSRLQEARTTMQRARDREQMTLREVLGGDGSAAACASLSPMPTVANLSGNCRASWDAVNARLAPYVGSVPAAAQMMTDATGRPILVDAREVGCPGAPADQLLSVHPTGDRAKPPQTLALTVSGYGC